MKLCQKPLAWITHRPNCGQFPLEPYRLDLLKLFVSMTVILTLTILHLCVCLENRLLCSMQRLIFCPCGEGANTIPSFYGYKQTRDIKLCYFPPPLGKALLDFRQLNLKTDSGSVCFDPFSNMFSLVGWLDWSVANTWFKHFAQVQLWRHFVFLLQVNSLWME